MINPTAHGNAPTAPTVEASNTHVQLGQSVARLSAPVNPPACPHCAAIFNELVAARNLITAYEATAERRAHQRRMISGQKGGQR